MILDAGGRKIRMPESMTASAVIFISEDGDSWAPMKPYNVPDWVKEPVTMGCMMRGEILEDLDSGKLYKAEKVDGDVPVQ